MSYWLLAVPVIVATVTVLIPGLVIAYAAGARGVTSWGLAPVLSLTVFTVVGLVFGVAHIPFTATTVTLGLVVLVALVSVLMVLTGRRFAIRPRFRDPAFHGILVLVAVVIASTLFAVRFVPALGSPDAVSQTFDAIFHLNGVRYILDTHDANPLAFMNLNAAFGGPHGFYPNLWHMLASFVAMYSGASVPIAVNAFNIVIAAVVWPLGCLAFVRMLLGARPVALVATGVLSASFAAFPMLLLAYGVLYPNALGIAVIPAGLAALMLATGTAGQPTLSGPLGWVAFCAILPGTALAHPNAFVSLLVIGFPLAIVAVVRWFRAAKANGAPRARIVRAGWMVAGIAAVGVAILLVVRPAPSMASWGPSKSLGDAVFRVLLNGYDDQIAVAVSVLAVVGVIATFVTKRNRWLSVSAALVAILYICTATLPIGIFRYGITGTWYSDAWRLVALTPVVLVPLCVIGVMWMGDLCAAVLVRTRSAKALDRTPLSAIARAAVSLAIVFVVAIIAQVGPSVTAMAQWTQFQYRLDSSSPLLSTDERELLERVPHEVPRDAVVVGDPWTGTSLVWALSGRRALVPHIYGNRSSNTALILQRLNAARPNDAVCRALRQEGVTYALDFGKSGVFGETDQYPGVHHLTSSRVLSLVDHQGTARLYKVTGCR